MEQEEFKKKMIEHLKKNVLFKDTKLYDDERYNDIALFATYEVVREYLYYIKGLFAYNSKGDDPGFDMFKLIYSHLPVLGQNLVDFWEVLSQEYQAAGNKELADQAQASKEKVSRLLDVFNQERKKFVTGYATTFVRDPDKLKKLLNEFPSQ